MTCITSPEVRQVGEEVITSPSKLEKGPVGLCSELSLLSCHPLSSRAVLASPACPKHPMDLQCPAGERMEGDCVWGWTCCSSVGEDFCEQDASGSLWWEEGQ